jgi:Variant SH3 domain
MSFLHDHPSTSFFVRAAFHYRATDASSIDLAEGDLIEVFSQLENGWWDGRLVTKSHCPRGWFPGTFVVPVSDDEAQQEIISAIYRPIDGWFGLSSSDHLNPTKGEDITYITSVVDDFWLPDVMTDGRVRFLT